MCHTEGNRHCSGVVVIVVGVKEKMSFVTNVITPIFQLMFYLFMLGGLCWLIYRGIKNAFPNLRWTLKYKIFQRKFKEEDVAWCMDAVERGMSAIDIKKFLLINGRSTTRANEFVYIFNQIHRRLKGGDANDRKFRQSHGQDQEEQDIPKIPS
jgi:hypothetical protein